MKSDNWEKNLMYFLPGIFALPIAFFAPKDILRIQELSIFVSFVESIIPMIKRIDSFQGTWQVAKLYYSVTWCLIPISTLFWIRKINLNKAKNPNLKKKNIFTILVMLTLALSIWYFGFSDGESMKQEFISYSRLGMASLGGLLMATEAVLIAYCICGIFKFKEPIEVE